MAPRVTALFPATLAVFFIAACNGSKSNYEIFDYELQGTWESNDKSLYSGRLDIHYDYIIITGYEESQTPRQGNDANRPFRIFTKKAPLKGYSEEGKLFINDAGILQEGIPYNYYKANYGNYYNSDYREEEFLRFTFGGRVETLQKTAPPTGQLTQPHLPKGWNGKPSGEKEFFL